MGSEMKDFEKKLLKEIEGTKVFSFKRLLKILELNGLNRMIISDNR